MKKMMDRGWMMILAFVMVSALSVTTTNAQGSVSLQVFYDELQPYGTWMDYGSHGYVWIPRVDRGFVPYATSGYWINTEYGNTWVSDYEWGWAPFHYGRWLFDDFYGWIWVPGTEWAPAWVAWRSGGGYYGWAPLMPGMGIHASFHFYNSFPAHYWSFVPYRYVTYRHVYNHCVPRRQVVTIINNTTIITHNHTDHRRRTYFTGPSRNDIERRGGGRVTVHKVNEINRPGRTEVSRSTANIYRPEIDDSRDSRSKSAPSTFVQKNRQGNLEQVETVRKGNNDAPTYRRSQLAPKNGLSEDRNADVETRDESIRRNPAENSPRREYQPVQRTPAQENQNSNRTYQRIPQERQRITRDRYEAPPLERAPSNREIQRQSDTQPRQSQQVERQNQVRQQRYSQPDLQRNPSINSNSTRSSTGQPERPAQIRRNDSGNTNAQPSRSSGGSRSSSELRKRN